MADTINKASAYDTGVSPQVLALNRVRVIFDAVSICQSGFAIFAKAWLEAEPSVWCHIPNFEYSKLKELERNRLGALISARRMSVINCGTEPSFNCVFAKMNAMGVKKVAFVLDTPADIARIDNKYISVQSYKLLDNGVLLPYSNSDPHMFLNGVSVKPEPCCGFSIASHPEQIVISPLLRHEQLGIGKTVYTSHHAPIVLKTEVMVNADSITYATNQQNIWAKIYAPTSLTNLV